MRDSHLTWDFTIITINILDDYVRHRHDIITENKNSNRHLFKYREKGVYCHNVLFSILRESSFLWDRICQYFFGWMNG